MDEKQTRGRSWPLSDLFAKTRVTPNGTGKQSDRCTSAIHGARCK